MTSMLVTCESNQWRRFSSPDLQRYLDLDILIMDLAAGGCKVSDDNCSPLEQFDKSRFYLKIILDCGSVEERQITYVESVAGYVGSPTNKKRPSEIHNFWLPRFSVCY